MINKFTVRTKMPMLLAAAMASALAAHAEAAEWSHGIGSGFFGLNLNGELGFDTDLLGPIEFNDIDLSTSDLADVTESAFGLSGFSTDGTWTIFYGGSHLKLEDSDSGTTLLGVPVALDAEFKWTKAQLGAAYTFARTEKSAWSILGGADYTKQDYDNELTEGATITTRSTDHDWTDAIVGLTNSYRMAPRWRWANRIDAGFGGSDGSYHARTALDWDPGREKAWVFSLYADYKKVDFEDGSQGEPNWYKYDIAEFGPGFGFGYVFGRTAEGMAAVEPAPAAPEPVDVTPPPPPPSPPLDTDGDSVADTDDQCFNTPAGDKVDSVGCSFDLRLAIQFDDNSATLKSESYPALNRAFQLLLRVPTMTGVIEGHTDSRGSDAANQRLSERRAKTVLDYLVDHGVDPARIDSKGYGESQPVADNNTPEGQAQNRRVVLHRADTGDAAHVAR